MDRLFLDANVLFSAAYKADALVYRLWKRKDSILYSSRYALEEARVNLPDAGQLLRLTVLAQKIQFVEAGARALPRGVSLPEKDEPILRAAIEARTDYLLTGDLKHFGSLFGRKIEGVTVTLPGEYLRLSER